MGIAAKMVLSGQPAKAKLQLTRVGKLGANMAQKWFRDPRNGWAPNTHETAARKINKMRGRARKEAMAKLDSGEDMTGVVTPLIDTGQLLNAIIYVIRENNAD